jgi:hypothetical protein
VSALVTSVDLFMALADNELVDTITPSSPRSRKLPFSSSQAHQKYRTSRILSRNRILVEVLTREKHVTASCTTIEVLRSWQPFSTTGELSRGMEQMSILPTNTPLNGHILKSGPSTKNSHHGCSPGPYPHFVVRKSCERVKNGLSSPKYCE